MPKKKISFQSPEVAGVFHSYPEAVRERLLQLRTLIFEVAKKTPVAGELTETLKWGEPSYLTEETKSGTTVRIAPYKGSSTEYGVFVNCQTTLVETYRERYPKDFRFDGKRALLFDIKDKIPAKELSECIAMALTYHVDKRK